MNTARQKIPEIVLVTPKIFNDHRGRFLETHRLSDLEGIGIDRPFVQSNVSTSLPFTIRGMHYQTVDGQGKFVRCLRGEIYDVAIDMREGSRTLGKWVGIALDEHDLNALWVPPGFAHGFLAGSQGATVHYECTSYYVEEYNTAVRWDDPTLGITWPLAGRNPVISSKDRSAPLFADAQKVRA